MSGGSWDYVSHRFDDVASRLRSSHDPLRRALGHRIALVAKAMSDIEWVDSSDWAPGDEVAAIKAALGESWPALTRDELRKDLDRIIDEATKLRDQP